MANAAQNAPKLEIGKLTPEDSERLALSFRPAWELDDAPFAHVENGNGMSAEDIDALAGGAGVASSVRGTLNHSADATTEIDIDVDAAPSPEAAPPPPAPRVAEARAQKDHTPPRAPAPTVKISRDAASGEYGAVKKSNTGIIVGIVAVVAVIGGIFGIRAAMSSGEKTASTATTSAPMNPNGPNIPPPPDNVAATTTATVTAQPLQPPPVVKPTNDVPVRTFPEATSAPTHQAAAIHTTTTAPTHVAAQPTHTTSGTKPPGHGTIVRDNPF